MDNEKFKRLTWWLATTACLGFWVAVIYLMIFHWHD
jgi:hypothetical protein